MSESWEELSLVSASPTLLRKGIEGVVMKHVSKATKQQTGTDDILMTQNVPFPDFIFLCQHTDVTWQLFFPNQLISAKTSKCSLLKFSLNMRQSLRGPSFVC